MILTIVLLPVVFLCLSSAFFFVEIIIGAFLYRSSKQYKIQTKVLRDVSSVILVPAHNEESVIAQTLENLTKSIDEHDRVIVIADNCDDQTASIARTFGFEVLERESRDQRGKGYALAFGLASIEDNPPDIVIVVDADCEVMPGTISHLKIQADHLDRYQMDHLPDQQIKKISSH